MRNAIILLAILAFLAPMARAGDANTWGGSTVGIVNNGTGAQGVHILDLLKNVLGTAANPFITTSVGNPFYDPNFLYAIATAAKNADYKLDPNRVGYAGYIDANLTVASLFGVAFRTGDVGFTVVTNGWPVKIGSTGDPNQWVPIQDGGFQMMTDPNDSWKLFCADANATASLLVRMRRNQ